MRQLTTLASGLSFAEGLRWRDGALYFSDMHADRVMRIYEDGRLEVVTELEVSPSGLGWLPDGRLLISAMQARRLIRLEPDGRLVEHADVSHIATHHTNDMVVGPDGTAYVGNFGFSVFPFGEPRMAALARVALDGEVSVAAEALFLPNGTAITPDRKTLIIAESGGCCLTAFTITPDGALTDRRIWAKFGENEYPDGICLDSEGAAWVGLSHNRRFVRVREGGEILESIDVDGYALTCNLGGADRRTLFMGISAEVDPTLCRANHDARILTTRVEVPGAGWP